MNSGSTLDDRGHGNAVSLQSYYYSLPGSAWQRRSGGSASIFPSPREAEPLDIGFQAEPGNQLTDN